MRTTVTLDPDVATDLKRRARRTGKPFREVLNDAVRRGLRSQDAPPGKPYRLRPTSLGGVLPGVDLDRALRLADALEDESIARELELREMILVDANLLIYAIDADSPHHAKAKPWLEELLSSTTHVGLAWVVILAFLRVTTRPGILRHPLPLDRAIEYVNEWLGQPCVVAVGPAEHHWPLFSNLLKSTGTAGNLVSDSHLAALAIEHGYAVYSTDHDFKRFSGVAHVNPLE